MLSVRDCAMSADRAWAQPDAERPPACTALAGFKHLGVPSVSAVHSDQQQSFDQLPGWHSSMLGGAATPSVACHVTGAHVAYNRAANKWSAHVLAGADSHLVGWFNSEAEARSAGDRTLQAAHAGLARRIATMMTIMSHGTAGQQQVPSAQQHGLAKLEVRQRYT